MIDARGKWISSTLAGVMSQLVLYELWHHGRRCAADLAFLGDLFPAFSRPLLDGLVGSLEAGGFVRTSKNPVDCQDYFIDLRPDRRAESQVVWPERDDNRLYAEDSPIPLALQGVDSEPAEVDAVDDPSRPVPAPDGSGEDPHSDRLMPRLVEIGPGEAVCIATGGRLFATADSFCDFEAVALNDSEGNEVAGLAWTDNVPTLTIPQAAGGYRRFRIVGGGPSEFTDDEAAAESGENGFRTRIVEAKPGEIVGVVDQAGGCLAGVARDHDGQSTSLSLTTATGTAVAVLTTSPAGLWLQMADSEGRLGEPFQPVANRPATAAAGAN